MAASTNSSKRRKASSGLAKRSRQNGLLYMPLDTASANQISLRFRTALEMARTGRADSSTAQCLAQATLLTGFVSDAGFGQIDSDTCGDAETGLVALIERGHRSGDWTFSADLLESLTAVVNEHDRQLLEVRMCAIIEATDRLRGRLAKARSLSEILSTRKRPDVGVFASARQDAVTE
jgi:2C-methyl-D-erythritol 2,4-cyclodiphosphate synthase